MPTSKFNHNKKSDSSLPLNVYFQEYPDNSISYSLFENVFCTNWKDLSDILYLEPAQIIFDVDMITQNDTTVFEFVSMLDTLIKLSVPGKSISIAIGINKDTPNSLVKDLRKTSVAGILPSSADFGPTESNMAIESMLAGNKYWPKHIIDQLPGNRKITITKSEIKLTNRQAQVYDLIATRGLSNKQIAKTLNISESTIKVHVSAIMKALCVRNRTQLALTK